MFCLRTVLAVLFLCGIPLQLVAQTEVTVRIDHKGKSYFGKPVAWDRRDMVLLRTDGRLTVLPATKASDFPQVSNTFKPVPKSALRKKLLKEFGGKYQVSVLQHFVVVHPKGPASKWAQPFETLYHRVRGYFSSRHFSLNEPEFPMVAVVLKTRGEFDRFLKSYHGYDREILGYYNPRSNRIITYDQTGGRSDDASWFFNAETIIHEATHQTAYNTGIHTRFGPVPRWMSEGLAMMFEAPGVNNSMYYTRQVERINRDRLLALKQFYKQKKAQDKITSLLASDQMFRKQPQLAYALSWGLTFYLAENFPRNYFQMLRNDAERESFAQFSGSARLKAFADVFGPDIDKLEVRMENFIRKLPVPERH